MTLRALTRARALVSLLVVALLAVVVVPLSSTTADAASGNLTGNVFNDLDMDGVDDGASEVGIAGAVVSVYSATALLGTGTTDASGNYTIAVNTGAAASTVLRLELQSWPAGYEPTRYGGIGATANQTTVRFITFTGAQSGLNFGLQEPGEYCQSNPNIATTVFCVGNGGHSSSTGTHTVYEATYDSQTRTASGLMSTTGSVSGVAWDPVNGYVYLGSYIKRHAALIDANGADAIYRMNPTSNTTAHWFDLASLTPAINVGEASVPTTATRGITNASLLSTDATVFPMVGKYGIGDIDFNGVDTLYVTNLFDRTVHAVNVPANGSAPTTQTSLGIPNTGITCTNGTARPFGLGYHDGRLYAGIVCDAASGSVANLDAYVMRWVSGTTWEQVGPRIDLDYDKGTVYSTIEADSDEPINQWHTWSDTFAASWDSGVNSGATGAASFIVRPTPMLTDIDFDEDGNMVLGFRDRTADMIGADNYPPNAVAGIAATDLIFAMAGGDVLRMCASGASWVLQGAAGCALNDTNGQGPNNNLTTGYGEYFAGDASGPHAEISNGYMAIVPRTNQVLLSAFNADDDFNSGGIRGLNDTTGAFVASISANYYTAERPATGQPRFGKANGMGDLEALCDAAPLEIGNRIWEDTDQDGIQDPGETGINGVTVQLLNSGGTVVGTAVTSGTDNGAGQYYFRTGLSEVAGGNGDNTGGGLSFRQAYSIRVGIAANYTGGGPLAGMILTTPDATPAYAYTGDPDTIDSNPTAGSGVMGTAWFPTIAVSAASTTPGNVDHTYDVGFYDAPLAPSRDLALRKTVTSMSGTPASGTVTFLIEIFNQTADSVNGVTITDYIDTASFQALTSAPAGGNTGGAASLPYTWAISGGSASGTTPQVSIAGVIPGNSSVTVPITLTIASPVRMAGLRNHAEISVFDIDGNSANGTSATGAVYDVDSKPDTTNTDTLLDNSIDLQRWTNTSTTSTENTGVLDEDDHDIATVPVYDLALIKTRAGGQASTIINGATTANFTITVKNQGQNTAYGITVLDEPDSPMTRSSSTAASQNVTTSPASTPVTVTYNSATGVFTIPVLAPGQSVSFTAITNVAESYGVQVNRAEITSFDDDSNTGNTKPTWVQDMDSTPDSNIGNDALQQNGATFPIDSHNNVDNAPVNGANALDEDDHDAEGVQLGLLRIGSTVYRDAPGGTANVGDPGEETPGVRVQLFRENGASWDLVGTTVTDANGDYSFDQLRPGVYQVGIPTDQTTAPADPAALYNWVPVSGNVNGPSNDNFDNDGDAETGFLSRTNDITLTYNSAPTNDDADDAHADALTSPRTYADNNSNLNIDFVFTQLLYQIGNLAWLDTGAGANYDNGIADLNEPGIGNITVELFPASDTTFSTTPLTTTTSAAGNYVFSNLPAGEYVVRIPTSSLPAGYAAAGTPVAAGNEVDNDNNANLGTGGWNSGTITVGPGSTEPTTENDGNTAGPNALPAAIVNNRANQTNDFGFVPSVRIGNQVWRDQSDNDPTTQVITDNNGVFNAGERGLGGVTVQLWIDVNTNGTFERVGGDSTGLYKTTTTNSEGNYWFEGVRPGRAYFVVIPSIGSLAGAMPASSEGQSAAAATADNDDDGAPVGTDLAVSRVFTPAAGTASTGEADAVEPGDGSSFTDATAEAEANAAGTSYADADSQLRIDFGFIDVPVYRLGDLVWNDNGGSPFVAANEANGRADINEPGIAGVTVELVTANLATVLDTTVTDANGEYVFENLVAGDYRVRIPHTGGNNATVLAGLVSTLDGVDSNDNVDNDDNGVEFLTAWVSSTLNLGAANPYMGAEPTDESQRYLASTNYDTPASLTPNPSDPATYANNRSNLTVDFGFMSLYRIGNLVWNDENNNGWADAGEPPLANVVVELWRGEVGSGSLFGTTSTDTFGFYSFTNLLAGEYTIHLPGTGIPVDFVTSGNARVGGSGPGLDVDNDNNAVIDNDNGGFSSGAILLGNGDESELEVNRLLGADDDNDSFPDYLSNYTVDFGFTLPPEERDLALIKTVIGVDPELEWDGGSVMFGITVTNQGTESVEGITVVDYIDGDYFADLDLTAPQSGTATDNAGVPVIHNYAWENLDADKPTAYIDGILAPGASVTIPLVLDVDIASFAQAIANGLVNFAEISEFDTDGYYLNGSSRDGSVFDTDSIPDTTDDDTFAEDDDVDGKAYQNTNSSPGPYDHEVDEDDHDRADVPLYDLALIKERGGAQSAYISAPGTVIFDITVKNQGATDVFNVDVEDYLDATGHLELGANATQNVTTLPSGSAVEVTYSLGVFTIDALPAGESVTFQVVTEIDAVTTDTVVNRAEITAFDDDNDPGNIKPGWVFDFDSTTDDDDDNDDTIDGEGTFPEDSHNTIDYEPVHGINDDDEDDYDTEAIEFAFMRIGSTVYIDSFDGALSNDIGDIGEGVEGVLVVLLKYDAIDGEWDEIGGTVTNSDGDYSFDQLLPGTYRVGIPSDQDGVDVNEDALVEHEPVAGDVSDPEDQNFDNDGDAEAGWLSLSDNVVLAYGTEQAENSGDKTRADVLTSPRTYATGNSNLDIDFVFEVITYELGNLVWLDTGAGDNYNNGIANNDEEGIDGVEVSLYRDGGDGILDPSDFITSTTTSGGGFYTFTGLIAADDYVVYIPTTALPLGYGSAGTPVLVGSEVPLEPGIDNNNNAVPYSTIGWQSGPISLGPVGDDEQIDEQDGTTEDPAQPAASVADERANQTIDFGFIPSMRIGNQVWHDESDDDATTQDLTDNNGTFDNNSGEVGLVGVAVDLWLDRGPLVSVGVYGPADGVFNPIDDLWINDATTNDEGNYWFTGVRPDLPYFVAIQSIGGMVGANPASSTGQSDDVVEFDNDDDGAPAPGYIAVSQAFTPTLGGASLLEADGEEPGDGTEVDPDLNAEVEADDLGPDYDDKDSELRVDFGFVDVPRYRLGNLVWRDNGGDAPNYVAANENNGWADPNEPGIAGVVVELYVDDDGTAGPSASDTYMGFTVTNSNGKYAFENLSSSDYWVRIDAFDNVVSLAGLKSTVDDGSSANDDVDNDDNGTDYSTGWASSVVSLNAANAYMGGEPTNEVLRRNETVATDDDTSAAFNFPVVGPTAYNDNRSNFSVDFGFVGPYRIGNLVWNDVDNDGQHDSGELGIANVTVQLRNAADSVVSTTVTDGDGFYAFQGLDAGDYSVHIPAPHDDANNALDVNLVLEGWFTSGTPVGTNNDDTDNDNNGVVDGGGWTSGTFTLGATNEPTTETEFFGGTGGDDDDDSFADERSNYTVDFGFWIGLRLGNLVWHDESDTDPSTYELSDNNGVTEFFEDVIEGAEVELWRDLDDDGLFEPTGHDSAQNPLTDTTDAEGNYLFTGLAPGSYFVAIVSLPSPAYDGFVATAAVNAPDNWNKGVPAAGYLSVSATKVVLATGGAIETGEVDVLPDEPLDDGFSSAEEEADTTAGDNYRDVDSYLEHDFGFVEPPAYRIGNLVWQDDNRNGIADAGEPGIVGVLVQLLDSDGDVIAETLTSGASPSQYGKYEFTQTESGEPLAAGTYRVRIPVDQTDSVFGLTATAGALDGLASTTDVVDTDGTDDANVDDDNNDDGVEIVDYWRSGVITLGPAESEPTDERLRDGSAVVDDEDELWAGGYGGTDARSNFTIDFGFYPGLRLGDFVWYDDGFNGTDYTYANENNGVFDAGERPVQGLTVQLFADTGILGTFEPGVDDATPAAPATTTSPTGYYYFTGLDEDVNYWVVIPATEQDSTEPLDGWLSSDGHVTYGEQTPDGNGTNNTDHGAPATGYAAVSPLIDLVRGGMNYGEGTDEALADTSTGVAVPNVNSNLVVDFGFKPEPRYELGNLVWRDDDDGMVEPSEFGIEFVTVRLYGDNGSTPGVFTYGENTEVATAVVTDANGRYTFSDLPAGNYFVFIADQAAVEDLDLSLGRFDNVNPSLLAHDNDNNGHPVDASGTTVGWVSSLTTLGDGADDHSEPATEEDANTELSAEDSPDAPPRDDRSDQTIDFGFSERVRLGNLVWRDEHDALPATEATTDNNGVYDQAAGEVPLAGVDVELWHDTDGDGFEGVASDDVLVGQTTSSVSGNYYFSRLVPGDGYYVAVPSVTGGSVLPAFDTPPGARSSAGQSGTSEGADNDDDGAAVGAYASVSKELTLTVANEPTGEQDGTDATGAAETAANTAISRTYDDADSQLRVDFGFIEVPLYRIGNLVWYDENGDGRANLTEPGIDGVRVDLYKDNGSDPDTWMGATVTDANGKYAFENLVAGDYYVVIPDDQSDDLSGTLVGLDQYALSNLVNSQGWSLSNNDYDNYDDGDPVSGTGVVSGVFTLGDTDPDAAIGTEPDDTWYELQREMLRFGSATDDDSGWTNGPDNRSNFTIDFGFYQQLRLGNVVWLDDGNVTAGYDPTKEDNGIADPGELGINGVTVALYTSDGLNGFDPGAGDTLVATTDTQTIGGVAGTYVFDNLNAGNYIVAIVGDESAFEDLRLAQNPSGGPEDADDDNDGVASGATDASLTTPVTYAWASDVIALAYGGEPTDEAGNFLDGTSGAAESALNAYFDAANGATPYVRSDNFSQLRVDFGFSPVPLYSLGNLVWEDWNNNGIVDEFEPAIEDVTVELYLDGDEIGVDAPFATDETDSNGQYQFTDLPAGDYVVHIPASHNDADNSLDVNLAIDGWFVGGKDLADIPVTNANNDVDNDNNAVPDAGNGGWTAGVVTLGEGDDHSELEGEEDANTETTAPVAPRDDRSNQTVDFGFWRGLRLGNQVWLDEGAGDNQNNGVYDTDETPLVGVTVQLWLDDGDNSGVFEPGTDPGDDVLVTEVLTDSDGHYYFPNVDEGVYFVAIEEIPGGGVQSSYNGPTPSLTVDSEDDGIEAAGYLSVSPAYELTVGAAPEGEVDGPGVGGAAAGGDAEANAITATGFYPDENSYLTVDFGFINVPVYRIGNLVWNDYDNDGVAETGEPGIEGVRVELYSGDMLVDFVLTDEFGFYEFTDLVAGDRQVLIPTGQSVLDGLFPSEFADANGNNDEDNDSNATEGTLDATDGWLSGIVTLGPNTAGGDPDVESILETVRSDDATDDDAGQAYSVVPPAPRIDDDRSNYTVDFGFYSITLGNLVFFDTDGDGTYEPGDGDDGIANVTVNLYAYDNVELEWNFVKSTTTDADGLYLFTGLVNGIEYLAEIPATQFAASAALDGLYSSIDDPAYVDVDDAPYDDNHDRGIDPADHYDAVRSAGVTVESATEPEGELPDNNDETVTQDNSSNLLVDFGFYRLELGGVVWEDNGDGTDLTLSMKNNGLYEFEESPFANVELFLYTRDSGGNIQAFTRADGTHASTTTDANGNYRFTGLPAGDYVVVIPASQFLPAGALRGFVNSDGNDDVVAGPQLAPQANVDDENIDNGFPVLDAANYPIAASIFHLGPVRATELTLSPSGEPTTDGTPTVGYTQAMSNLTVDFGFWNSTIGLELGNQLWFDDDRDGFYDIGIEDPVPAGVVLYLYDVESGTIIRTTVTDANGQYLFDNLSAGRYRIGIAALNFELGGLLHGFTATPVIAEDPDDEVDSDSNGLPLADKSVWSEVVTLIAAAPIDEIDPSSLGIDNRMSDLTVDFGLVEIVLGDTGVSPNTGIFAALWMIVGGFLLLFVVRRRRRES